MEKTYSIGRRRAALARSEAAFKARLGRYSIKAADRLPFPMAPKAPTEGARLTLHLPERRDPPPPGGNGR